MKLINIHPLIFIVYYIVLIFFGLIFNDVVYLLTFIVLMLLLLYLEGILGEMKNILKMFIPIALIVIILNPLVSKSGVTKIYLFNGFFITFEALIYGVIMCASLFIILMIFTSYNNQVSYQDMLYVFSKKFPNISMIIVMALRFIPLLTTRMKEYNKIYS